MVFFLCLNVALAGKEQYKFLNVVLPKEKLITLSYDTICDQSLMKGFDQIVYLKAFIYFEESPLASLPQLKGDMVEALKKYGDSVAKFLQHINEQIAGLERFPPDFLRIKLDTMLYRVNQNVKGEEIPEPFADVRSGKNKALENSFLDIEAEMSLNPFTEVYLQHAKTQIINHSNIPEYKPVVQAFLRRLGPALDAILDYAIKNYNPSSIDPEMRYLVDFFNVFGDLLLDSNDFYQIVLNKLTHHPVPPKFKDEQLPALMHDINTYNIRGFENSDLRKIGMVDKLFNHENGDLYRLQNIVDLHSPMYTYHPNWLEFFRYEGRNHPFAGENPDQVKKIIDDGYRNIYYVYIHARKHNLIDPQLDTLTDVADKLYYHIRDSKCYVDVENPCDLSDLIPRNVFANNYLIMLMLLKPFSNKPGNLDDDDVREIVNTSTNLGVVDTQKNIPGLALVFPDFKPKLIREKVKKLDEDLKDVLDSIKQANKDTDEDPYQKRQRTQKKIDNAGEIVAKKFKDLYPEIEEIPTNDDELRDYLDAINTLLEKAEEAEPELGALIVNQIGRKMRDTPVFEPKEEEPTDEQTLPIENEPSKEKPFAPEPEDAKTLEKRRKINGRLNDWAIQQVIGRAKLYDNHQFVKYLDYTLHKQRNKYSNTGKAYFKYDLHNKFRNYDLYVFNYKVKEMLYKDDARMAESLEKERESMTDLTNFDFSTVNDDAAIFESIYQFEFMTDFFHLFTLFEVEHQSPGKDEAKKDATFAPIFDKIYKFLVDTRVRINLQEADPFETVWGELMTCMRVHRDHILNGDDLPDFDDEEVLGQYEEFDSEGNSPREDARLMFRPCKQSFQAYSRMYYFMLIEISSKHPQALQDHEEFFAEHSPVNTHELYQYLASIKGENWFRGAFSRFCSQTEDATCIAEEVYFRLKGVLVDNKIKTLDSLKIAAEFVRDKLRNLSSTQRHLSKLNAPAIWNILHGLDVYSTETNSYSLLRDLIDVNELEIEDLRLDIRPTDEEGVRQMAEYIALKYYRRPEGLTDNQRVVEAVADLLDDRTDLYDKLTSESTIMAASLKFLADFAQKYSHFEMIAKAIVRAKLGAQVMRWNLVNDQLVSTMSVELAKKERREEFVDVIYTILRFKAKVAEKAKPVAKPKTGPAAKLGGLGGLGGKAVASKTQPKTTPKATTAVVLTKVEVMVDANSFEEELEKRQAMLEQQLLDNPDAERIRAQIAKIERENKDGNRQFIITQNEVDIIEVINKEAQKADIIDQIKKRLRLVRVIV